MEEAGNEHKVGVTGRAGQSPWKHKDVVYEGEGPEVHSMWHLTQWVG